MSNTNSEVGRVLYIVRTWVPEDVLKEWDHRHTTEHIPDVVQQPSVRRARKYRVVEDNTPVEWQAQYVTVYEFDSTEEWERYNSSAETAALRQDYADRYGDIGRISRQVLLEVAEVQSFENEGSR